LLADQIIEQLYPFLAQATEEVRVLGIEVVGIDNPIMDCLLSINKIPQSNGFERLLDYSWQGGGKVSTALVTLGRLGVRTGIIGVLGDDPFGRFCIRDFKNHMVDTSRLIIEKGGSTTLSIVLVEKEKKTRSFIIKSGPSRALTVDDLDEQYISSARYLHLSNLTPVTVEAAKMARKASSIVVIDADHYDEYVGENLKYIDVLIGSEFFYKSAFGDNPDYRCNLRELQKKGPRIVVITLGDKGCVVLDGGDYFAVPAFNELEVVDTCGAGDVFHGAFIFGMLKGWDSQKTARFACAVSSIKCTRPGGRAGIPDYHMAERFLKDGYIDYASLDKRVAYYKTALFENNTLEPDLL